MIQDRPHLLTRRWQYTIVAALMMLFLLQDTTQKAWSNPSALQQVRRFYVQGMQRAARGKCRQAITAYKRALSALPRKTHFACTRARIHLHIGQCWEKLRNNTAAIRAYKDARTSRCSQPGIRQQIKRALRRLVKQPPPRKTYEPRLKIVARPEPEPVAAARPPRSQRLRRIRRSRFVRRRRRARRPSRYRRPSQAADTSRRGRALLNYAGPITSRRELARRAAGKKDKKAKKAKLQVWQRSKTNTVLSKVSVGGGKYLKLEKLRVSVQIEGMRVRTVIDHIYHNPYARQLQGTFKYTLPADASVSYYAMFVGTQRRTPQFFSGKAPGPRRLITMQPQQIARTKPGNGWGKLREARLVPAEKARQVYEEITRRRIDPALLEQDAPNTFTGRVFPINPKGYNRVIMAYEQTLPQLAGHHVYRFRFPPDVAKMIDFSLQYNPAYATLARSNLQAIRCRQKKQSSFVRCYWEQNKPKKDAVFYLKPKRQDASWLAGIDPLDNQKYLLAQLRVKLPSGKTRPAADQAIFMLDTSLSAQPDLFAAHASLLQKILKKNAGIKRFNVLFFDLGARWARQGWLENNAANRATLKRQIDRILLEGATDLSAAMATLARPGWPPKSDANTRTDVFVLSDGQISWGNRQVDQILYKFHRKHPWGQLRFFAYQLGIGSENVGLLRRLVRAGGALFPCLNRHELDRCATAHTKSNLWLQQVEIKGIGASQVMVAGRQSSIFDGAILTLASNYRRDGKATITLRGQYMGKAFSKTYAIDVKAQGDLGPRAWGEMALAQLLELEDPSLDKLAIAYAQHFIIPNRLCSFLVLETDKEYKQYGLDKWKQEKKVSDIANFLVKMWQQKGKPIPQRARWRRLLRQVAKRYKFGRQSAGRAVMAFLNASSASDFELETPASDALPWKIRTPSSYRKNRMKDNNDFTPFVTEARRRLKGHGLKGDTHKPDLPGAIRALSCITELHPSNAQGLRLVGYYLRAWHQPSLAAQLFWRVLQRRSFEPHAFRDVAISMMQLKRYGIAAAMYEVILAGKWHSRFGQLKTLAREEYALMQAQALRGKGLSSQLQSLLRQRKQLLGLKVPQSKLRVTVTWNTDNTDIDLWVTGPHGETCKYSRKRTSDGGELLQDIRRGYGPERYQNILGMPGQYEIRLHFYGHSSNVFGNETHASVLIVRDAGTKHQTLLLKNLVLKKRQSKPLVHRLKL